MTPAALPSMLRPEVVRRALPGVLVCLAIAAVSWGIGRLLPVVGGVLPAVVIGVVCASIRRPSAVLTPGIIYSSKTVLQVAVVVLGTQLSLPSILAVGLESLPVMLSSLAVCLIAAFLIGRALRIPERLRTLIGVGTGICGASAISAVSPVIAATSAEVSFAVATIFLFNILAVVLFPLLGHAFDLTPHAFGLLAGTAVNDTSSVVAAAGVFGAGALGYAVVVKLVRTLMIIPISITLSIREVRRTGGQRMTPRRALGLVPWFLIGFVLVAVGNTFVPSSPGVHDVLAQVSTFLIAAALAGIGLSTNLPELRRTGWRPFALGGILWLMVTATAIGVMALMGMIG